MIQPETINEMTHNQLVKKIQELDDKVENRKKTCRKSSKKYYDKKFQLGDNPTPEEVKANKEAIERRDKFQSSYYERNKEKVKTRQKNYRLRIKTEKAKQKELEKAEIEKVEKLSDEEIDDLVQNFIETPP